MTDYEFAELQREIQDTMEYLERLQKRHIKETGKRYLGIGMVKKRCAECGAEYHGGVCPVCHEEWKEAVNV